VSVPPRKEIVKNTWKGLLFFKCYCLSLFFSLDCLTLRNKCAPVADSFHPVQRYLQRGTSRALTGVRVCRLDSGCLTRRVDTRGGCFRELLHKFSNSKARRFRASI